MPRTFSNWRALMAPQPPIVLDASSSSRFVPPADPMVAGSGSAGPIFADGSPVASSTSFHGETSDDFKPERGNGGAAPSNGAAPPVALIGVGLLALAAAAWYFMR